MEEMSDKERERGRLPGQTPGAEPSRDASAWYEERERHVRCAPRFFLLFCKKADISFANGILNGPYHP